MPFPNVAYNGGAPYGPLSPTSVDGDDAEKARLPGDLEAEIQTLNIYQGSVQKTKEAEIRKMEVEGQ